MRTISFSDARNNLKQVLDRVVADADATIITRRDAEDVVVISLDTWNSWQETEYLLSNPANAKWLRDSIAQLDAGKSLERELVEPNRDLRVQESAAPYTVRHARKKPAKKPARKDTKKRG